MASQALHGYRKNGKLNGRITSAILLVARNNQPLVLYVTTDDGIRHEFCPVEPDFLAEIEALLEITKKPCLDLLDADLRYKKWFESVQKVLKEVPEPPTP